MQADMLLVRLEQQKPYRLILMLAESLDAAGKSNRDQAVRAGEEQEGAFGEGLSRVEEHVNSTASGTAVCLICLETMGNSAAVWHCWQSCHCVFHLVCIQVYFLWLQIIQD